MMINCKSDGSNAIRIDKVIIQSIWMSKLSVVVCFIFGSELSNSIGNTIHTIFEPISSYTERVT